MNIHQIVGECLNLNYHLDDTELKKLYQIILSAPKPFNEAIDYVIKNAQIGILDIERFKSFKKHKINIPYFNSKDDSNYEFVKSIDILNIKKLKSFKIDYAPKIESKDEFVKSIDENQNKKLKSFKIDYALKIDIPYFNKDDSNYEFVKSIDKNQKENSINFIKIDSDYFNELAKVGKCCWDGYCWMTSKNVDTIRLGLVIKNKAALKLFEDFADNESISNFKSTDDFQWDKINIFIDNTPKCVYFIKLFQHKLDWNRVLLSPDFDFYDYNIFPILINNMDSKLISRNYIPVNRINIYSNKINFYVLPYHKYSREDLIYIRSNFNLHDTTIKKLNYILDGDNGYKFNKKQVNDLVKFDNIDSNFIRNNRDKIRWKRFSRHSRFLEIVDLDLITYYQKWLDWKILSKNLDMTIDPFKEFKKYL